MIKIFSATSLLFQFDVKQAYEVWIKEGGGRCKRRGRQQRQQLLCAQLEPQAGRTTAATATKIENCLNCIFRSQRSRLMKGRKGTQGEELGRGEEVVQLAWALVRQTNRQRDSKRGRQKQLAGRRAAATRRMSNLQPKWHNLQSYVCYVILCPTWPGFGLHLPLSSLAN